MSKVKNVNDLIKIGDAIAVLCRKTCHPGMFCPDTYCKEMWDEFDEVERISVITKQEDEMYKPYEELEDQMHEKAKDFASMLLYAANCIQYYLRIESCNDCNTCGKNPECEYLPRLGETTRINCPLWEEKKSDESKN